MEVEDVLREFGTGIDDYKDKNFKFMKSGIIVLTPEEMRNISSIYLDSGRKQDTWEITHLEIEGKELNAEICMSSYYISPTDPDGFHLPMYPPIEFISQLMIIYVHVWADIKKKTQEGWMIECSFSSKKPIRDPENIKVHMQVTSIRKFKEKIYIVAESRVYDDDGLFEGRMKCLLS